MSVDDQLREAFGAETWDVETATALRQVNARAGRARLRNRALAGVAGIALLVGIGTMVRGGPDEGAVPVGPNPSGITTSPSPVHPTAPTAIDGTWTLGPVSAARIRSTLRDAGQGRWYGDVKRDFPPAPLTYRMTIRDGRVDVWLTGVDGKRAAYDQEYVTLSGHRALLEPIGAIGANRYRWALVGGRLRLTFVSTSEGREDVQSSGAFQRALYTVADWTRAGRARSAHESSR